MSEIIPPGDGGARVLPFRPRKTRPRSLRLQLHEPTTGDRPLARYEHAGGEDDYRHRMMMNALALLVTTILVLIGVWLTVTIAEMRRNQDCYLQGQQNCNHIVTPPRRST